MRKYLILTSLLALTGCMLGDGGSSNGLLLLFDNDVYSKSMFAATPEDAKKSNSNLTNMESVFDFSDRIVEIWNKSGIELNVPESELPELYINGAVAQNLYDQMSDEKKLTLRKAEYIQRMIRRASLDGLDGLSEMPSPEILHNMVAWINAAYDIESKGQITQKLNPNEIGNLTNTDEVHEYFGKNSYYMAMYKGIDTEVMVYSVGRLYPNEDTGEFVTSGMGSNTNRIGNTNSFTDGNYTFTYNMFGKLSYMDYGFKTTSYTDLSGIFHKYKDAYYITKSQQMGGTFVKDTPETWKFAGGAVGTYYRNTTGDPDGASHTLTMRTNNATLEVSGDQNTGINAVLNMPFANWYDVKATASGGWFNQVEFSNYTGDAEHKITGNLVTGTTGENWYLIAGDYMLDPTEAGGEVAASVGGGYFHGAFGMTRQE